MNPSDAGGGRDGATTIEYFGENPRPCSGRQPGRAGLGAMGEARLTSFHCAGEMLQKKKKPNVFTKNRPKKCYKWLQMVTCHQNHLYLLVTGL